MTVLSILIFCFRLAGELARSSLCCLAFFSVISFCRFHLSEGTSWMPMYVYDSFCVSVGKFLVLYVMFCDWMKALNVLGLSFDLFGQPVMAYLTRLRSIWAHSANFCSLVICGWRFCIVSERMARSSAYADVVHEFGEVLK